MGRGKRWSRRRPWIRRRRAPRSSSWSARSTPRWIGSISPAGRKRVAPAAIVVGTAPDEVWIGHDTIVAEADKDFADARKRGATGWTRSNELHVTLSDDGHAAWVSDRVDFGMQDGDQKMELPLRITEVLAEQDGAWWVVAAHFSVGVPNDQAFKMAAEGTWPALADIPDRIGEGAEVLAAEVDMQIRNPNELVAAIDEGADVVVIGTAPEEFVVGGLKAKETFGGFVRDMKVTMKRSGTDYVAVAPGGQVGWAVTSVDFGAVVDGKMVTQPYRVLMVYAKRGGAWKLVQAHFSNGVPEQ